MSEQGGKEMSEQSFHRLDELGGTLGNEVLEGARPVSIFVWGKPLERKLYHIAETSNTLPLFRLGSKIAARKSVIRATFWAQERRAFRSEKEEELVQLGILLFRVLELIRDQSSGPAKHGQAVHWTALLDEASKAIERVLNRR